MVRRSLSIIISIFVIVCGAYPQSSSTNVPTEPVPAPSSTKDAKDAKDAEEEKKSRPVTVSHEGLLFSTSDESSQLRIHGYLQGDAQLFLNDTAGQEPDRVFFRRVRPLFEGVLFRDLDFRVMPDFGMNKEVVQEAYIELKSIPVARVRVGKFKTPLGLEILRSDRELTFVERSLVSQLLPLRDIGAQVGGAILRDTIDYEIGYYNGVRDGQNANFEWNNSGEGVARVFVKPFTNAPTGFFKGLGLGLAGSGGYCNHGEAPSFQTMGLETFFKYRSNTTANGEQQRLSPQAYYYHGRVGVLGEYVISSQWLQNKTVLHKISNQAWQLGGSVVLTGDKNAYGGVYPAHAFNPKKGLHHLGAWELAARYSTLRVDAAAFPLFANPAKSPQQARESVIGLNWYVNRYAKLIVDWGHTNFDMISGKYTPLQAENVVVPQIQLQF